ncbi:MAG: Flp pilus assembly complex ATPase component TadA [candidate division Zixibacteria bacterium]|nr:Flp pilus assembly complex ATPase component TadA [Candidatus Tariuqbacter arcticus]
MSSQKIGEILIDQGVISQEQLKQSLGEQRDSHARLGDILVSRGFVVEEDVYRALAEQMGIDFFDNDAILGAREEVVRLIPEDFAKQNVLIAVQSENSSVRVAMADPDDIIIQDALVKLTKMQVEPVLATPSGILQAIEQLYIRIRTQGEVNEVIGNLQFFVEADNEEEGMVDMTSATTELADAPIVKLVNMMIAEALKERSTDIHIEVQGDSVLVRYRIDGVLQDVMRPPRSSHQGIISRLKIISKLNIAEKRLPQDGRFTVITPNQEVDVRVSLLPCVNGEKMVLRLLDKSSFTWNLTSLGFDDRDLKIFRRWIKQPYGMVILSGPTGCGKSTTLYAALNEIKSTEDNITTVEDPVEYHMDGINQVQVKPKIGLTFASTIRHILRQDPDKCLIGEIRDSETADIAVKFSLTGHLVFTTLHANDAPSTITRLIDIGVPEYLVGSCLNIVMAQRLVRKICPNCKGSYKPEIEELQDAGVNLEEFQDLELYRGRGCVHCRGTGYFGRTGIFEIMEMRQPIRRLVFDNANQEDIRDRAFALGMRSLREEGFNKVKRGVTTLQEIQRITVQEY